MRLFDIPCALGLLLFVFFLCILPFDVPPVTYLILSGFFLGLTVYKLYKHRNEL